MIRRALLLRRCCTATTSSSTTVLLPSSRRGGALYVHSGTTARAAWNRRGDVVRSSSSAVAAAVRRRTLSTVSASEGGSHEGEDHLPASFLGTVAATEEEEDGDDGKRSSSSSFLEPLHDEEQQEEEVQQQPDTEEEGPEEDGGNNNYKSGWKDRQSISLELSTSVLHRRQERPVGSAAATTTGTNNEAADASATDDSTAAGGGTAIPLQTEPSAALLYDTLAPHLTYRQLGALSTRLTRFVSSRGAGATAQRHNQIRSGTSLVYKIHQYFSKEGAWVRPLLCRFLIGEDVSSYASAGGVGDGEEGGMWDDPTYPPNVNRTTFEQDVQTLMDVRDAISHHPPMWGPKRRRRRRKSDCGGGDDAHPSKDRRTELDDAAAAAARCVHGAKSDRTKRLEAEAVAEVLADRLPRRVHERLVGWLAKTFVPPSSVDVAAAGGEEGKDGGGKASASGNDDDDDDDHGGSNRPQQRLGNLSWRLRVRAGLGFHTHLVALELAEFLYVADLPPSPYTSSENGGDGGSSAPDASSASDAADDPVLSQSWERWNATRSALVQEFLDAQREYARLMPREAEVASSRHGHDVRRRRVEETVVAVNALRERVARAAPAAAVAASASSVEVAPIVAERPPVGRPKNVHIVFDALVLSDDAARRIHEERGRTANRRRVYLNNLPIDVEEEELRQMYSRCGPMDDIRIFNKRPDLDPGVLSKKRMVEMRRRKRHRFKREVQCTPVYAMVDFATDEGYDMATNSNLTIFGMVIRKHPVRSIPAKNMRSLFIENIPPGFYSMDLEYKLSKVLHPEIYACLDVGDHDYMAPTSCEIKFPSHEVASFAFDRLQQVHMGSDDCVLNWIRTPRNAMEYWTRELGFDS